MTYKTGSVQALDRGISLLESISAAPEGMALAQMAEVLKVSQPAAFNLARTWINRRYLEKMGRPVRYRIGPMLYELAVERARQAEGRRASREVKNLAGAIAGSTVLYAEPIGADFRVTFRMDPDRPGLLQRPMSAMPNFYAMATGTCLFAFLDCEGRALMESRYPFALHGQSFWRTRAAFDRELDAILRRGYGIRERGEPFRVAAPVFGQGHTLISTIGLSLRGQKVDARLARRATEMTLKAARSMARTDEAN